MLKQLDILKLAYHGAMEIWGREYDRVQDHPNSKLMKARFKEIDITVNEIRNLIVEEELKQEEQENERNYD